MRIAYVINSVEGGGAAFPVPAVANALRNHDAEVTVYALTRRDGRALAPIEQAGFRVVVREGGEKDHLAAYRWLRAVISEDRPDLIWTSLSRATLLGQQAGKAMGIPVASWQHAAFLRPANRRLLRLTKGRSQLWICDSERVAEFTRETLRIADERLVVWPIFAANAGAEQAKAWTPGEPVRIGTLGRLHPVKGFDVLLDAVKSLKGAGGLPHPFEISIGGTGVEREYLADTIGKSGLEEVRLVGFVDDAEAFHAGQHMYVQPSRSEGFCVAAHEAMQAGLPVIGSRVGEMARSIVPDETGWLVSPGDALELAAAIKDGVDKAEKLSSMGACGRARVLNLYGPDRFNEIAGEIVDRLGALCRSG